MSERYTPVGRSRMRHVGPPRSGRTYARVNRFPQHLRRYISRFHHLGVRSLPYPLRAQIAQNRWHRFTMPNWSPPAHYPRVWDNFGPFVRHRRNTMELNRFNMRNRRREVIAQLKSKLPAIMRRRKRWTARAA